MAEIAITSAEQEVALGETQAVQAAATEPGYLDRLRALEAAIGRGALQDEDAETLADIVELALQTGRVRAIYGPPGEQAALRLFRRLPRGQALTESTRAVSQALASLRGRTLEGAELAAVGPGSYTLSLRTAEARVSLRLDRQGARLATVEV